MTNPDHLDADRQFLSGGGKMGQIMRAMDWHQSSLGPLNTWPQSLRTIIGVCLNSRLPVAIFWGKDFLLFYNDFMLPILDERGHPLIPGSRAKDMRVALWDIVEPMLHNVLSQEKPVLSEHQLLLLSRNEYTEECYFTSSLSPVQDESGRVSGAILMLTETTRETVSARHLNTLRDLFNNLSGRKNESEIYHCALEVIRRNNMDFPFSVLYKTSDQERVAIATARTHEELPFPDRISLADNSFDQWKIKTVIRSREVTILEDPELMGSMPGGGASNEASRKIMLFPIIPKGTHKPLGVMVVGMNPCHILDAEALSFYKLFADQIASQIAGLENHMDQRDRAEALAEFQSSPAGLPNIVPASSLREIQTHQSHVVPVIHCPMKGERNPKILVADVNPEILDYIRKILSPEFWVDTSSNGKSALAKIIQSPPDLVITESIMPATERVELLEAIKSDSRTAGIPVIVLTAQPAAEQNLDSHETGADDYLIKPFSGRELIARVNSQIRFRQARRGAEEFLRDLFEQAPVPICFLKGAEFYVDQANAYMLKLWGKQAEDVIGKPMAMVFPELVAQGFFHVLGNVFQNGERFMAEEVPLILRRGEEFEKRFVSFVYEPFKNPDGKVIAIVVVGHDVTRLVEVRKDAQQHAQEFELQVSERTAELRNKNEELVFKNSELEQFTFLASHDLQEPLRKIQTFSGLMMYNLNDPAVVEKYVNKIVTSVSRMSGLIQSLLDYSRVSQNKKNFVDVDLNQILRYVLDDLELPMTEKRGVIRADSLPVIRGDPRQLGQLFLNLIQNAIKFSEVDPIITITWRRVEAFEMPFQKLPGERNFICVDFEDNGIGFDQVFADKIFEIFKRLHGPAEYAGTGIGLALCKKIVENHGGAITVESRVGKGSTFHVYLPEYPQ